MNEVAKRNKANTMAFLKAVENMDTTAIVKLFAEQGVQFNPYGSGLFPEYTRGLEEIKKYWEAGFSNFEEMEFIIHDLYAMEDPTITFARFKGKVKKKDNEGLYENDYYATFKFDEDGKITEYVEIFNPIVAAEGFNMMDKALAWLE